MLRTLLQRKKKAIFILPFVSVVSEKADYLSKMFKSMDICVHGFYANKVRIHDPIECRSTQSPITHTLDALRIVKGGPFLDNDEEDIDIAVCTIEKVAAHHRPNQHTQKQLICSLFLWTQANNLLNRLLEEDKLDEVGIIVIDEVRVSLPSQ
jgi:hypothetical protein